MVLKVIKIKSPICQIKEKIIIIWKNAVRLLVILYGCKI